MIAIAYWLLLILFGCKEQTEFNIQIELQPYYNSFMSAAQGHALDQVDNLVMIIRQDALKDYGGLGVTRKDGQRHIYIDAQFYTEHPDKVEIVVWHELGHCYLNRRHCTSWSIMNTDIGGSGWPACYGPQEACAVQRKALVDELFRAN